MLSNLRIKKFRFCWSCLRDVSCKAFQYKNQTTDNCVTIHDNNNNNNNNSGDLVTMVSSKENKIFRKRKNIFFCDSNGRGQGNLVLCGQKGTRAQVAYRPYLPSYFIRNELDLIPSKDYTETKYTKPSSPTPIFNYQTKLNTKRQIVRGPKIPCGSRRHAHWSGVPRTLPWLWPIVVPLSITQSKCSILSI